MESGIERSYLLTDLKEKKHIDSNFVCWIITQIMISSIKNKNKRIYLHQYDVICKSYIATFILTKQRYLSVDTINPKSTANF